MFSDELTEAQAKEIDKLKAQIAELEINCRKLNMVYKAAWDIASIVCGDGSAELIADQKPFSTLYDSMVNYDNNQDLRDSYTDLVSDWM